MCHRRPLTRFGRDPQDWLSVGPPRAGGAGESSPLHSDKDSPAVPIVAPRVMYLINAMDIGGVEIGLLRLIDGGFFSPFSSLSVVALSIGSGGLLLGLDSRAAVSWHTALTARQLTLARTLVLLPRLYRLVRSQNPDVLVMSLPQANVIGRVAGRLAGVPCIAAFEHNTSLRREYLRLILRLTSSVVTAVLYDSDATARAASRYFWQPTHRPWHWVPLFATAGPPPTRVPRVEPPYRVLTVARLEDQKNLKAAIEAIGALRQEGVDVRYDIVGSGSLEGDLKKQALLLGIEEAIHLNGFRADWRDLAAKADVYFQPSIREGACLAALEAMQCGLPVVGTPTGGLVDYAKAGRCVWLTDGFTTTDLTVALRTVLQQPALRESLMRAGASFLATHFSPAVVEDRYRAVSQALCAQGANR